MNNTLFEQFSGTYTQQSDYLLPNLTLSAEEETSYIGVWGQHRLNYLKCHPKSLNITDYVNRFIYLRKKHRTNEKKSMLFRICRRQIQQ